MSLEEYLKAVKECPDNQLQSEYGVYDNYTILLQAEFETALFHLMNAGKYLFEKTEEVGGLNFWRFNYYQGTVNLQLFEGVYSDIYTGTHEEKKAYHNHNLTITIHNYQKIRMGNVYHTRAIALVLEELCTFFKQENIPFCLPKSSGEKRDFAQVVFHPENRLSFA